MSRNLLHHGLLWRSLARIADIGGTMGIPRLRMPKRSDKEMLRQDWEAICGDFESALIQLNMTELPDGRKRDSNS